MLYIKQGDGKIVILPPQQGDDVEDYLRQVRQQLDEAIAKGTPGARHYIELESGQRGGSFANSSLAVAELLTELVDASHSTASKKCLSV